MGNFMVGNVGLKQQIQQASSTAEITELQTKGMTQYGYATAKLRRQWDRAAVKRAQELAKKK